MIVRVTCCTFLSQKYHNDTSVLCGGHKLPGYYPNALFQARIRYMRDSCGRGHMRTCSPITNLRLVHPKF